MSTYSIKYWSTLVLRYNTMEYCEYAVEYSAPSYFTGVLRSTTVLEKPKHVTSNNKHE